MKILILTPLLIPCGPGRPPEIPVAPDVELAHRALDRGSASIESYYDEYIGAMDMVQKALEAREEGFDAIVIDCFMNPMMEGLRELLDIPVVGAGEAALHVASMLGDNFSIIDPDPPHRTYSHRVTAAAGLLHKLRSVRYLNMGVAGLSGDSETILERILGEAVKAVEEDGAHVIVLGCTGMRPFAAKLAGEMEDYGVPVVEPLTAAVSVAEALVRLRLRQSKVSYPKPPEKKRVCESL